jgi:hypothetical protein
MGSLLQTTTLTIGLGPPIFHNSKETENWMKWYFTSEIFETIQRTPHRVKPSLYSVIHFEELY